MGIFGVVSFILGVLSLAIMAIRRSQNIPASGPDHLMMFIGIAGTITGLAVIFLRFN